MARVCEICGKGTVTGNNVSHSKNRLRRTWKPNLVKVKTMQGKTKKMGRRIVRNTPWKKAIVTLRPGDKIEYFEGV